MTLHIICAILGVTCFIAMEQGYLTRTTDRHTPVNCQRRWMIALMSSWLRMPQGQLRTLFRKILALQIIHTFRFVTQLCTHASPCQKISTVDVCKHGRNLPIVIEMVHYVHPPLVCRRHVLLQEEKCFASNRTITSICTKIHHPTFTSSISLHVHKSQQKHLWWHQEIWEIDTNQRRCHYGRYRDDTGRNNLL